MVPTAPEVVVPNTVPEVEGDERTLSTAVVWTDWPIEKSVEGGVVAGFALNVALIVWFAVTLEKV